MVLNLHMNGHINESEKTQTINWIEEKIQNLGPSVKYLCDFLEEKLATKDDEKLRAAWVKWYKSAIRKRKKQHKK